MRHRYLKILFILAGVLPFIANADSRSDFSFDWQTVVNNTHLMPPLEVRHFNSYNQPSVNMNGLVVLRARSRGGPPQGPPTHGIYTRDMSEPDSPVISIMDRTTPVPYPNNLESTFVETPAFPRIDMWSETIATRANHQPLWRYHLEDGSETRAGTTGIYSNSFGALITASSNLGHVSEFSFLEVPDYRGAGYRFEVFPGAPSVASRDLIAFKGNYTDPHGNAQTGVYFRNLANAPHGGSSRIRTIANSLDTLIPGSDTFFGSTSPPTAVGNSLVFVGLDNEEAPTRGGIYLAPLREHPQLTSLVNIGSRVQGESAASAFNKLGEGMAFDGRFVGFWGAWGDEVKTVRLHCPAEGNRDRIAFCNQQLVCRGNSEIVGDPNSICNDAADSESGVRCYQQKTVPANQGIFVVDTFTGAQRVVAKSGESFDDFLFWNYSGKPPCSGRGHSEEGGDEEGEHARWRSSAYLAIASRQGHGSTFNVAFKARSGDLLDGVYVDPVDGIYLQQGPGRTPPVPVLHTGMVGQSVDPMAPPDSIITELGIEREGLRGTWLTLNASMTIEGGTEEDGMAGIYITRLPERGHTGPASRAHPRNSGR